MAVYGGSRLALTILSVIVGLVVVLAGTLAAHAQTQQDLQNIQRQQDRILQQREQQQRLDDLRRRQDQNRPSTLPDLQKPIEPGPGQGAACFDAERVVVTGVKVIAFTVIRDIAEEYETRCLTLGLADELVARITNAYITRGYTTTRAYIPAQDISDGTFEIIVVEGVVKGIRFNGTDVTDLSDVESLPADQLQLVTALPGIGDGPFNIRDLEQGLDQMNRLRSSDVKTNLVPGDKQGESILTIESPPQNRLFLTTGHSNMGQESTGEMEAYATISAENMLRLNDAWMLSHRRDVATTGLPRGFESISASLQIPWGYWTFGLTGSHFQYESQIDGQFQTFEISGSSRIIGANVSRVIHRDNKSKTSLSGGLTSKTTKNFVEDILITVSSRSLTVLNLGLSHSREFQGGILSASFGSAHGLGQGLFGALEDENPDSGVPRAQFHKLTADFSYYRPFRVFGIPAEASTFLSGQWALHTLFDTERISIGGPSTVRGFRDQSISGDIGAFVRNELAFSWTPSIQWMEQALGTVSLFAGLDVGVILNDNQDPLEQGTVAGWTTGMRRRQGIFAFEVAYSQPFISPNFLNERGHQFLYTTSLNF